MNTKQNLHTHSKWCDGKNTVVEMIDAAIGMGFGSLGFSGHSPVKFPSIYAMTVDGEADYKAEVSALKKTYDDRIKLFCGVELDTRSCSNTQGYDYVIGSHHYFLIDDTFVGFDRPADAVKEVIDTCFGGDGLLFAKAYYNDLSEYMWTTKVDILGHFDIITKNCEKVHLFDWNTDEYNKLAFEAISALKGRIPFFEVNTGAISRGYRTTPYPTLAIMEEFKRQGYGVVITSDCHDKAYLDCGFELARDLLRVAGFCEKYILTENGFNAVEL